MECPKCGYERQEGDTECPLCGADYAYYDNLEAEKKKLKQQQKQQADERYNPTEDADPEPAPAQQAKPRQAPPQMVQKETKTSGEKCPKCKFDRIPGEKECSNCGLLYAKYEEMAAAKKAEEEARKKEEAKRVAAEKARIQKEAEKGIAKQKARKKTKEKLKKSAKDQADKAKKKAKTVAKKHAEKIKDKNVGKKVIIFIVILAVVGIGGKVAMDQVNTYKAKAAEEKRLAQEQAELKKQAEERKKIAAYFNANHEKITKTLKEMIYNRRFAQAEKQIKYYDIPALSKDPSLITIKKYLIERKLFEQAKGYSGSEVEKNYNAYKKLTELNPHSDLYKKKLKYYKPKYADVKYNAAKSYFSKKERYRSDLRTAIDDIETAIALGGAKWKYRETKSKLVNANLGFYEGNGKIEIAISDKGMATGTHRGQRDLYVWIRNVGADPFFVNLDYFTLIGKNKRKYKYNDCDRGLVKYLKPGESTEGHIYFYTNANIELKELIFAHVKAGTVTREFP